MKSSGEQRGTGAGTNGALTMIKMRMTWMMTSLRQLKEQENVNYVKAWLSEAQTVQIVM